MRALLDSCAEATFIAESVVQLLELSRERCTISLRGLGDSEVGTADCIARFTIRSIVHPECTFEAKAIVRAQITGDVPGRNVRGLNTAAFRGIDLADPQFYKRQPIHLLIGAGLYGRLVRPQVRHLPRSCLTVMDTALGWVVFGEVGTTVARRAVPRKVTNILTTQCEIGDALLEAVTRFWETEAIPTAPLVTKREDIECETQFRTTHYRDDTGRFTVSLPLRRVPQGAGEETRKIAIGALRNLHRKFAGDADLAREYREFLAEYERLGHMERVKPVDGSRVQSWYLPHHPVFTPTPTGRKIRVVFDASRRTRNGQCLNDFLKSGPSLQRDLMLVLVNWRQYEHVFTADIVKMFRQIRVRDDEQDLQRIVWSPTAEEAPVDYRLKTVTYGTASAPFLAIRTLHQIAEEGRERFPLGAHCLTDNTYVDDIFDGSNDVKLACRKRQELIELLATAGVSLDKWAASNPQLLPASEYNKSAEDRVISDAEGTVKTLGVRWNARADCFTFQDSISGEIARATTKRQILSGVSRLFDPLGWLSPVVVAAKVLMQDVCIAIGGWDDRVPEEILSRWKQYCASLTDLPRIQIRRWLGLREGTLGEIHGFCDASERAYAACVYVRLRDETGRVRMQLIAAKTKVAPIKTISIPNLELCGATLLVQLVVYLRKLEWLRLMKVFMWSDSQIVLAWLGKHPRHWRTYVANRVSYIQTELPAAIWGHVRTDQNPADLGTRGATPGALSVCSRWWYGPKMPIETRTSEVSTVLHVGVQVADPEPYLLRCVSEYEKLLRVTAYVKRWRSKTRSRLAGLPLPLPPLTDSEVNEAAITVMKMSQEAMFGLQLKLLKAGQQVTRSDPLSRLAPFIDSGGLLRVGGRLAQAELSFESKHPPILSGRSVVSRLLARRIHRQTRHGGFTLTMTVLLQHAWIIGARRVVKTTIRTCLICQRIKPKMAHQLMGNLPVERLRPARPFTNSGVDYAGPILVKTAKGRGHKTTKGYVVLFVCFATRAIHLELASDLTSQGFIAAFRRFVSRRGLCATLYSDNATNFRGADRELRTLFHQASQFYAEANATLIQERVTWKFIPPGTPHYGGLWEAGVKSVKFHLRRTTGEHQLTFEEWSTVLAEIEACLNSRPLSPLTSELDDLRALTPAHFLIGTASGLVPDADMGDIRINRLDRHQLLQRIRNYYWKRWSNEYILQLQERAKWRSPSDNLAVGRLVVLRDDRCPPGKWPLGRIIEVFPGEDGKIRVIKVRTATGTFKRHVARVSPLHLEEEDRTAMDTR